MNDRACVVPLHERLALIPKQARLVVESADGMETSYIPVGVMCHEAAEVLRKHAAGPSKWDERLDMLIDFGLRATFVAGLFAIGLLIGRGLR